MLPPAAYQRGSLPRPFTLFEIEVSSWSQFHAYMLSAFI